MQYSRNSKHYFLPISQEALGFNVGKLKTGGLDEIFDEDLFTVCGNSYADHSSNRRKNHKMETGYDLAKHADTVCFVC